MQTAFLIHSHMLRYLLEKMVKKVKQSHNTPMEAQGGENV
jgi:hypothetical protein